MIYKSLGSASMIQTIRALLLICCLTAVFAVVLAGNSLQGLKNVERVRLPVVATTIVEDISSLMDPAKLKTVCTLLAVAIKAEAAELEARYRSFTDATRQLAFLAMGFSAVAAIVLLAAWLAMGKVIKDVRSMRAIVHQMHSAGAPGRPCVHRAS